jgi:regulation of enolase protein 1 (concanavalin A-like superfamily)
MRGPRVIALVLLWTVSAGAQEALPLPAVAAIKDATVMITTEDDDGVLASGSGFLIRVEGQTGYVATNHHVIEGPARLARGSVRIMVILRCGTRQEQKARGEVLTAWSERDLAIVKISDVKDLAGAIDVLPETEPVETMPVYVFGFPFGRALAMGRGSTSVVVGKGSISSVRRNADGAVSAILIDGALNPGTSGGPVVDARGRLVGVAVAAIRGANIGIAIPRRELLAMLAGRPADPAITAISARAGAADLTVEVLLEDPFDSIKQVTLLHDLTGAVAARSQGKGREVSWGPLAGAQTTALAIREHRARGSITIAAPSGKDLKLTFQIAYTGERGQPVHTKPGRFLLGVPAVPPGGGNGPAIKPWGQVIDPDGDCKVDTDASALKIEVPGALHDLNGDTGTLNSPRVVQNVDGDFVVQVKVCGEFQPHGPSTRNDALPYHGAGLIVWLDRDHFIRMERGAVLRDRRVGAFLLYTQYQPDQPALERNAFVEAGDVYLKIERRGSRVLGFYGTDGHEWAETAPLEITWPARLKVGLDAVNSAFSPLAVRFEGFSISKPAADQPP